MDEFSLFVFLDMILTDMFNVNSVIIVCYAPCFLCVFVLIYFIIWLGFLLFFMYM